MLQPTWLGQPALLHQALSSRLQKSCSSSLSLPPPPAPHFCILSLLFVHFTPTFVVHDYCFFSSSSARRHSAVLHRFVVGPDCEPHLEGCYSSLCRISPCNIFPQTGHYSPPRLHQRPCEFPNPRWHRGPG